MKNAYKETTVLKHWSILTVNEDLLKIHLTKDLVHRIYLHIAIYMFILRGRKYPDSFQLVSKQISGITELSCFERKSLTKKKRRFR